VTSVQPISANRTVWQLGGSEGGDEAALALNGHANTQLAHIRQARKGLTTRRPWQHD